MAVENTRRARALDASISAVKILRSALGHGCTPEAIVHVISSASRRTLLEDDPDKWLYLGVDAAGRPLEIVTVRGDDGAEVVIHAMKMRKRYFPRGGRR